MTKSSFLDSQIFSVLLIQIILDSLIKAFKVNLLARIKAAALLFVVVLLTLFHRH